jgi:protoheme IX farnesyltransferase
LLTLYRTIRNYIEVLKPAASILLAFVGIVSAIVAAGGNLTASKLVLTGLTVLLASAGANGLTNYLDRHIDARMPRTSHRALPSGRISPPEKVLPLTISLVVVGMALAWSLQSAYHLVLIADVVGTTAALVWRKKVTCVFPQGMLASCTPVVMGWFSVRSTPGWELAFLCGLIGLWLPLHVWSVMIARRGEYIGAGLTFFPMSRESRETVKLLPIISLILTCTAIGIYFTGTFGLLYLVAAILLSGIVIYTAFRLASSGSSKNAWRLYKLSSFPYLGLIFLAMCIDVWIL